MHHILVNVGAVAAKGEMGLIRGPKLEVLVPGHKGVPFDEALRIAERGRRVIASNARLGKVLVCSKEESSIMEVFNCWTGTMAAYVEPGSRFRGSPHVQKVASLDNMYYQICTDLETGERYLFPIYEQYLDARNLLLLSEYPDYSLLRDGKYRIVKPRAENSVDAVANFPSAGGFVYLADPNHGIPQGDEVNAPVLWEGQYPDPEKRYLRRASSRVGPVSCSNITWGHGWRRVIGLNVPPSVGFGVAAESPATVGAP